EPGGGARLCDPATHRPRPDHRDLPHVGNAHRTTHRARNIRADLKNALRSIRQTHIGLAALRRLVPPMRHLRSLSAVIGLAVALASYSVWHITTTTTPSGGSATVQDSWVQDSNLGTAQTNITFLGSTITVKYDPPLAEAVFPLAVNAQWSLSTTVRFSNSTFTLPFAYGATVIAENTTTVAAGSFSVAVIQRTSSGGGHDRDHYSEGAGNHVRRESYDANGNRVSDQQLTSYRYQSSTLGLLLIGIGIAVVAVIAIAVLVTLRRRRAR